MIRIWLMLRGGAAALARRIFRLGVPARIGSVDVGRALLASAVDRATNGPTMPTVHDGPWTREWWRGLDGETTYAQVLAYRDAAAKSRPKRKRAKPAPAEG